MRILQPSRTVYAYFDGRVAGYRFAPGDNWVDDGALSLGIASYAIVDANEAVVYDTHVSVAHGNFVRNHLRQLGAEKITVVLSHHHLDHVAGTSAFRDCPVVSNARTAAHMTRTRTAIENGTHDGLPAINPLVMPTQIFENRMQLRVGSLQLDLIEANIHSDDATVIWIADEGLLLAGDTMEDTITYVAEPEGFEIHLRDLDQLWELQPERILPNHGDPEIMALGGYEKTLIRATQQYIRMLKRMVSEPELREKPLNEIIRGPLDAGWVNLFKPYEAVHKRNIEAVLAAKLS